MEKAVYVTQEARQLQNEGTLATYVVKGLLRNIHGDWAKKEIKLKGTVWDVTDSEEGVEETLKGEQTTSLNTQKDKRTKKQREVTKEAHCFPRRNGHALIPLGGPRGYICGMFRAAARTRGWNKQGNKYFGALSFVDNGGFTVSPDWFETNGEEVKMKPFFVKEAKGEIFFEYIEKVPFEVKVSVMKNHMPEDMALQLIGDLERLPIGPKRRGALEIASIQKLN
jgi:hypothetical protein